eukprot:scaffold20158_cov30-Tisochrysis_lutea.AAC.1
MVSIAVRALPGAHAVRGRQHPRWCLARDPTHLDREPKAIVVGRGGLPRLSMRALPQRTMHALPKRAWNASLARSSGWLVQEIAAF